MANKMKSILLLWVLISILFMGCQDSSPLAVAPNGENIVDQVKSFQEIQLKDNGAFQVDFHQLPIPEGGELGDITIWGNKVYYIVEYLKALGQANAAEISNIYELDIVSGENKLIYEYKHTDVAWINELRADEQCLYWTEVGEKQYNLIRFHLTTGKAEKIHSVYNESIYQPMVLGGSNEYFSWYEYDPEGKNFNLMFYHLKEQSLASLKGKRLFFDTFDRPSIYQDHALVVKEAGDQISFNLFDLERQSESQKFDISKAIGCAFPQVSEKYIIWRSSYGENNIYVYHLPYKEVYQLDFSKLGIRVFSAHLSDHLLYINTNEDLLICNLEERNYGFLTKDSFYKKAAPEYVITLGKFSLDGQYVCQLSTYSNRNANYYVGLVRTPKSLSLYSVKDW